MPGNLEDGSIDLAIDALGRSRAATYLAFETYERADTGKVHCFRSNAIALSTKVPRPAITCEINGLHLQFASGNRS